MSHDISFQCTRCCAALSLSAGRLLCPACQMVIPLHSGIPSFTNNDDYFFGEIPSEAMIELAAAVDRIGWDAAFEEMCDHQHAELSDYIRQYIADASRANWKYLLQLPKDAVVLDFGCGWGETTLSLARSVGHVVSMDLTLERLLLLQARTRDKGLCHVAFAHGGDSLPLPFAGDTFDAVVLNGVLEWVPVTGEGDPRQCQLAILRELRRMLKPTGQLYIGIENRVGLKYFMGKIDEHSQMKYTSLLPRWLADRWSRINRGKAYRTYTYSRRGYVELLEEAGFEQIDFFCPYPDYREFDRIVPLTTEQVKGLFAPTAIWKRSLLRLPAAGSLLKWAVPSFSIIASDSRTGESRLGTWVSEISELIGIPLRTPSSYHSKPIGEVLAYCAKVGADEPTTLLRIAETPVAIDARLASAKHLESLWNHADGAGKCMDVIPRNQGFGKLGEIAFTAEEIKPGTSWRKIPDHRKSPGSAVLSVARWLISFQQATGTDATWHPEELRSHVARLIERVRDMLPPHPNRRTQWNGGIESTIEASSLERIPVVVCHGDLHLDNVLFSPTDKRLTGVVDWDLGEMRGLPLTDLVYLLLAYGIEVKGQSYCDTVESVLEPSVLSNPERTALSVYETAFALSPIYRRYAVQVAVLQNIITLSARRPEAFRRLQSEFTRLPDWLFSSTIQSKQLTA